MCERANTDIKPKKLGDRVEWVRRRTYGGTVTLDTHTGVIRAFRTVRQALCEEGQRRTWVDIEETDRRNKAD
jgi:hypothetical protein